jgi:hypothetical protein
MAYILMHHNAERGVDFELPMIAMHRASQLIQTLAVVNLVQLPYLKQAEFCLNVKQLN